MNKIFFTKDINKLIMDMFGSDFGSNTVVVYHAMYDKPYVKSGIAIEWEKYKITYNNYNPVKMILIGLNRMVNPSNRCDFIHAFLTVMTPHIPKISIDTSPFIGEPWRLYYHYQYVNSFSKFGANYSYPIEGEWRKWFERDVSECRFSPQNLKGHIVDTYSNLEMLTPFFDFYPAEKKDLEWYEEAKKFELSRFRSPKFLLMNLLKISNTHFKLNLGYDSYLTNGKFTVPDIGIYRFLIEENIRRKEIYNLFAQ